MPTISDQHVVKAIASEFLANGFCKEAALLSVGYSKSYSRTRQAMKLYEKPALIAEIERVRADIVAKNGIIIKTRAERQQFWSNMMDNAQDDTAKLRASELLGKSEADFIDVVKGENKVLGIQVIVKD